MPFTSGLPTGFNITEKRKTVFDVQNTPFSVSKINAAQDRSQGAGKTININDLPDRPDRLNVNKH